MNRRVAVVVLLIGIAMLAIGAVKVLGGGAKTAKDTKPEPMVKVVRAKVDIQPGTLLDEKVVEITQVKESDKAKNYEGAEDDEAKIKGGKAKVLIAKGRGFLLSAIDPPKESVSQKITPGYVAVTLAAPEKPSLYDLKFLHSEDRVDLIGVTFDEKGNWTTSTPLASSVKVLAVDKVWDKYVEQVRVDKLNQQIAELEKQRDEKAKSPGGLPVDQQKQYDDQIKSYKDQIEPEEKNPSVTVEVTNQQAQVLSLWRASPRSTVKIALHTQPNAKDTLFAEETLAAPLPGSLASTAGPTGGATVNVALATGPLPTVLSMDDVVPLIRRDPKQYAELLDLQNQIAQSRNQQSLDALEREVKAERSRQTLRNLRRYGTDTPPQRLAAAPGVPGVLQNVPPVFVPRGTGVATQAAPQPKVEERKSPSRYSTPIEVYRGSTVTVVGQ